MKNHYKKILISCLTFGIGILSGIVFFNTEKNLINILQKKKNNNKDFDEEPIGMA